MAADKILRFSDYERRSRNSDAVSPRDLAGADVIVLPIVRTERSAPREPDMRNVYTRACDDCW